MRRPRASAASYDPAMADAACEALINRLVAEVPALKPLYDDHVAFNDDLRPHVFFGDVTRFVTDAFAATDPRARADGSKVVRMLKEAMRAPEPGVVNLISVSFLENLLGEPTLPEIRRELGPLLTAELALYE